MEAVCSSKTSVDFQLAAKPYVALDRTLQMEEDLYMDLSNLCLLKCQLIPHIVLLITLPVLERIQMGFITTENLPPQVSNVQLHVKERHQLAHSQVYGK
jgi:hypothetical protein